MPEYLVYQDPKTGRTKGLVPKNGPECLTEAYYNPEPLYPPGKESPLKRGIRVYHREYRTVALELPEPVSPSTAEAVAKGLWLDYKHKEEEDSLDFQELRNQYPHLKDCPTKLVIFLGSLSQEEADQITEWFRRNNGNGS